MYNSVAMQDPMEPQLAKVMRVQQETYDTYTITATPHNGAKFMPFTPGQFNMLYAFGIGEVPISISGDPSKPAKLIHTIRSVGAVSSALCKMKPGNIFGVRGPYGIHWPVEQAQGKDVVIITGGIGLAPLRPAIYHLLQYRDHYNKIIILYGARTPKDLLYPQELQLFRGRFDMEVVVTVDKGDAQWRGHVGVVTTLFSRVSFSPSNTIAMICGPEVMMRFTIIELQKYEVPDDCIYLSMERNMKCGIGFCGHCQFEGVFVCKDGPVFNYPKIKPFFGKREI